MLASNDGIVPPLPFSSQERQQLTPNGLSRPAAIERPNSGGSAAPLQERHNQCDQTQRQHRSTRDRLHSTSLSVEWMGRFRHLTLFAAAVSASFNT
jgi:hypothetical protein